MHRDRSYDALVVGARCAGAATAMLMARRGMRVILIDRGAYGADTLSNHALMRGGVLQLHRWGVLPRLLDVGTPAVRTTTFHYGDELPLEIAIKPADGVDALCAPRRTVLDSVLVDAAVEAGVEVRHGHVLTELARRPDGSVAGAVVLDADGEAVEVATDLVVGADGIGSAVARLAGASVLRQGRHATAVVYGHWSGLGASGYRWYYREGVSAGVIPTNAGRHCVFASIPPERFRSEIRHDLAAGYRRVLEECSPELAASVAPARLDDGLRAFAGRKGFMRAPCGPGWALVGDAGYFKDPLTAHGITDALRDAELLADAAARGIAARFTEYAAARDALSVPLFEVTDAVAAFDWDLGRLKALHRALNKAMKQEVEHLLTLGGSPAAARPAPRMEAVS